MIIIRLLCGIDLCLSAGRNGLFGDFACLFESDTGHERTYKLIYENGKEADVSDDDAGSAESHCGEGHTEGYACLGKKGDAEVLLDGRSTLGCLCGNIRTDDLAGGAEDDVNNAYEDYSPVSEYGEFKFGTAEYEEENHDGAGPAVHSVHEFFGEVAEVAEHGTEHHAHEKGGEAYFYGTDAEVGLGKRYCKEDVCNGDGKTLTSGVEELFGEVEYKTDHCAEYEGCDNFNNGIYDDGDHIEMTLFECACDAEGDCENHKTYNVVESNYGKEHLGERTVSLVLLYNHEGCCRCGCGCDCAEGDRAGEGESVGHCEVYHCESHVNEYSSYNSLEDRDYDSLTTGFLQFGHTELVAHCKRDKAESCVGDDGELGEIFVGDKADAFNSETAETVGTDEDSGYQICGYCGKVPQLGDTGHDKTRKHCD